MTRIISGSAGGRRLQTPRGELTRPTTDRVREALFSAIESAVGSLHGLRFLDLYAGSGAIGLEARSRGAEVVTLVEKDKRTAAVIRANVQSCGLTAQVLTSSVGRHLAEDEPEEYDVVVLDPPYSHPRTAVETDLRLLAERGWLAEDALVVVERSARDQPPSWPEGLRPGKVRKYGETALAFARWYGPDAPDPQEPR